MPENKPFFHLFNTKNGYYVYDVNTNVFLKVPKQAFEALKSYQSSKQAESEGAIEAAATLEESGIIDALQSKGYLSSRRAEEIVHPLDNVIGYYLGSLVNSITLQVTQQCNLRCSYCAYSGIYQNRTHSSKEMSLETALKAIDFAVDHSGDSGNINIGFYGGEPLLRFELIKKCVEYTLDKAEGKEITFNMTTNATLLDEEKLEFLQAHDFDILVSLDGPKEIHDKNRKFANGCGTFDKVMENIGRVRELYPEYFDRKIRFNAVLDGVSDLSCINEFFASYEAIKDLGARVASLSDTYTDEKFEVSEEFTKKLNYERFKIYLSKVGRLDRKYTSRLFEEEFIRMTDSIHKNRVVQKNLSSRVHHGGPCIPGVNRLFCNTEGVLYPCERVSEESVVMKIGTIDKGFEIDKIRALINVGKITEDSCIHCWAFRYCHLCAAFADTLTELSPDKKMKHCAGVRRSVDDMFRTYCTLKELGCGFNDNVMEIDI